MNYPEYEVEIDHGMGELGKSRSQKKRESTALQQMGEELSALASATLAELELSPDLFKAIKDLRGIKKHEARRRQNQLIGRFMRELDEEEQERISAFLLSLNQQREAENNSFHALEDWRDALVNEDTREKTLAEVSAAYPAAEVKKMRHLAANAQAERDGGKTSKSYRELFKYLKQLAG
ncbi:DUF615 domain-containing protein [Desulfovibrio sp. OttesenSCG-928-F07]|nr:DUF615 domain-containing protein [Desulfovibrio sp. OttesenSCG-928-F07]